jgi:hypothetical protein
MSDSPAGALAIDTLRVIARRATSHPLVRDWEWQPDSRSPRRLRVRLDSGSYPENVTAVRLDVLFAVLDATTERVEAQFG